MDETGRATQTAAAPGKKGHGFLWGFIAVLLAFGGGFGWQYYEVTQVQTELAQVRQELTVERLRVRLGQAAIAAQAGDYESARRRMSDFFTRLTDVRADLPENVVAMGDEFLADRDDIITGLSRSNPEYAGILYGMLDRFRTVAGLGEEMAPVPAEPGMAEPAMGDSGMAAPGGAMADTTG